MMKSLDGVGHNFCASIKAKAFALIIGNIISHLDTTRDVSLGNFVKDENNGFVFVSTYSYCEPDFVMTKVGLSCRLKITVGRCSK